MKKRKILPLVLVLFTMFLAACNNSEKETNESVTVGISMPSKALERWEKDGDFLAKTLEEMGYDTDLQYAQDDVPTQVSQIENMVSKGADIIVIAPIDGGALSSAVELSENNDIPVIAYDRLIMYTEGISYYATFDNYYVGTLQAQYIVDKLGLESTDEQFNIELFGGSPDDNNAHYFFNGAWDVLSPFIDSGQLVVRSGQTDFNKIAIQNWDSSKAQARMDNLLSSAYTDELVDAILSPNDAIALGVVSSLRSLGYGQNDRPMPVITGQDAEAASVKSIIAGNQTMTVFKNTQTLAKVTATMVDQIMNGEEVSVNDEESYNNGSKVVATNLIEPVVVDSSNFQELLIESGYLVESDIK